VVIPRGAQTEIIPLDGNMDKGMDPWLLRTGMVPFLLESGMDPFLLEVCMDPLLLGIEFDEFLLVEYVMVV
jgi:hypothetical protein